MNLEQQPNVVLYHGKNEIQHNIYATASKLAVLKRRPIWELRFQPKTKHKL